MLVASLSVQAQGKRKIIMSDKSMPPEEIKKVNPAFLDSIYQVTPDGNIILNIQVVKGLDTIYVEDPLTGNLEMRVARKMQQQPKKLPKPSTFNSGDTIYVEDPLTGDLQMRIVD